MKQLVRSQVNGLLGRFDHVVEFPEDWPFVILHGPNGIGKTKLLELIHAASEGRFRVLASMPFEAARFEFSDGSVMELRKFAGEPDPESGVEAERKLELRIASEELSFEWEPAQVNLTPFDDPRESRWLFELERRVPVQRIGPDLWLDRRRGDHIGWDELAERYESQLPPPLRRRARINPEVRSFLADFEVHLIEAQRLFAVDEDDSDGRASTVMRFASDLSRQLNLASAQNSRTSVQLDRTFPRRVLYGEEPNETDDSIRARYESQNLLRRRLADIAVLDLGDDPDFRIPDRELSEWERRVLTTYLDDTDDKLSTFQSLLDRLVLFQDAATSFLFKRMIIDRERGFRFVTDEGTELEPDLLSTGEQHELVLTYDLLFNVNRDALVLIDEPEISLHVAWQQKFLDDISEIAEVVGMRFMIATHSPQIVHKWWSRTVPLWTDEA